MTGNFGPGFDKGRERGNYIGLLLAAAFVVWFVNMGFNLVEDFFDFNW